MNSANTNPKHTNPERPRRDRNRNLIRARAPYNFVELPDTLVAGLPPIDQDSYTGKSGWIECDVETRSPTFVRGMLTAADFEAYGRANADELTPAQKEAMAPFYSVSRRTTASGQPVPALPGSSLRGMIRGLVEIIGHGRMRWVADAPAFMFRAVAAPKSDPLRDPYNSVIGALAANVQAGYLFRDDENWWIVPAYKWPTGESFIKVSDSFLLSSGLPDYIGFNDPAYKPQLLRVSVDPEMRTDKKGKKYIFIKAVGEPKAYKIPCFLACSGNMTETAPGKPSPRTRQALVPFPNTKADPIRIEDRAVRDYVESLTPFQREKLPTSGAGMGALQHESLIFYVLLPGQKRVTYFGHSPNFRIPALLEDEGRAATPCDFVPPKLRETQDPDIADAIFGWVTETETPMRERARAGRVFVTDARCLNPDDDIWYSKNSITPSVLASPKPSSFQHYLVQDKRFGHDPDDLPTLAHYGTPRSETQIRGYKRYWHRGKQPPIEANASAEDLTKHASQYTRIRPLKAGAKFSFRIYFDNLHAEELGALLWAVKLPDDKRDYCHKLGMGKPLGMGALKVTRADLMLVERVERYGTLFHEDSWQQASYPADSKEYMARFETYVLDELGRKGCVFSKEQRIQMLLAMLEWRDDSSDWLEETRYMEIEFGPQKLNEYKERPVLPTPLDIARRYRKP